MHRGIAQCVESARGSVYVHFPEHMWAEVEGAVGIGGRVGGGPARGRPRNSATHGVETIPPPGPPTPPDFRNWLLPRTEHFVRKRGPDSAPRDATSPLPSVLRRLVVPRQLPSDLRARLLVGLLLHRAVRAPTLAICRLRTGAVLGKSCEHRRRGESGCNLVLFFFATGGSVCIMNACCMSERKEVR